MAKILIAEDDTDIRMLVEFTLQHAGHTVIATSNGAQAVDKTPQEMPDLILMDVRMPKMTGYEACAAIKAMEGPVADIPIVFLSAKGQEAEIDQGLDVGAYEYILKPFDTERLIRRVGEILQKFGVDG